jgi:hypothetical protein
MQQPARYLPKFLIAAFDWQQARRARASKVAIDRATGAMAAAAVARLQRIECIVLSFFKMRVRMQTPLSL